MLFDSYVAKLIKNVTSYLKYLMKYATPDMGTRQGQGTQGLDVTVLADIKMISGSVHSTPAVAHLQILFGKVPVRLCGGTVDNNQINHLIPLCTS